MQRQVLSDELTTSGQISLDDLQQLHADGIKTIICNRYDHEDPNQPDFETIAAAAKALGMEAHLMPVASGNVTKKDGEQFGELLTKVQKPVHAYCRSGTRCNILWTLSN
ncbi:MAG: sulfide:quinone oxidoreductase [Cellvibrionaceae bacterium]|jgi:sulfide:quinone oxidoreductase